jgi:integrase
VLSSAMSWAEEFGLRPAGPNPASIRLKGTRRRQRLFSDTEVGRLLNTIEALEVAGKLTASSALGLRLLFATGCRAGEICGLRWQNVDLDEGVLRWPDSMTGFLEKPITDEARALLESAERTVGVDWVCPSPVYRQLRVETLEAGFERVMKAAKVPANENATLHLIRHWFASRTYSDKSIPLPLQMAIVGHNSVATAMRYAHVNRAEVQQAARDAANRRATSIKAAGSRGDVVKLGAGQ